MTITADSVRTLERTRIQAMLANDVACLRKLISPQCSYVHTTGRLDTGESYLAGLGDGLFRYEDLSVSDQSVTLQAATAVVVYRLSARIAIDAEPVVSESRCTAVWAERHDGIQVIAFQATPVKP
ncbi:nuclear transport factor 2 family protein [Streptomyces sp. NBC_00038]|uniref:nuclear transport factor 2 family protein n=1 Tax=Streptomyces sp. NBC_00038 TaxID=2903615 RepID=UPI00224C8441|nr:nuclear transport factor 2 family protein [Streptomyces sp. NBC_00038]MCX5555261.1 nuclear transport factor 2 family protein [Streptomyces sp. NBC_00038]